MREFKIVIEPFRYVALLYLTISNQIHDHIKATLEIQIEEDKVQRYLKQLLDETWVKIKAVDEKKYQKTLFQGVVTDFSINQKHHATTLKLELASGTICMDHKKHFRTFQDPAMSYKEVHGILTKGYDNAKAVCKEAEEKKIGNLIIQYDETDWEFAKRLVEQYNGFLIADAEKGGTFYNVSSSEGKQREPEEGMKVRMVSDVENYMEKKRNGILGLSISDCMEVIFDSREIYHLMDTMTWHDRHYVIYKIHSRYERAECIHTYHMKMRKGLQTVSVPTFKSAGCSFDAVVTDVKRDKVKVEIMEDENAGRPERKWFVYSTVYSSPDGTGWYCMPEIGDKVQLYMPEKEQDGFIINSVHLDAEEGRKNPDHKSLKNRYGKEILFTPDSLLMTNNQGMKIEISDQKGILIESDKSISVRAGNSLSINSTSASLLLSAQNKVRIRQGQTTLTLEDDISFTGGEFRIQ